MDIPATPFSEHPPAAGPQPSDLHGREDVVDGVRLVDLLHQGEQWRLGAITPDWRAKLLGLPLRPEPKELAALARHGVWLAPHPPEFKAAPLAVMCCGQGSVWPGMGRALYDAFPAAREAMDRIAAIADWDVLSIMDETDVEKLGLTRWQQPYLFLLEYAQAHYLRSLGLRPDIMSGHSLGELIALCLADVYTPEVGWYIIDNRARLVGRMEAEAARETGMMSVHASGDIIDGVLTAYPDLRVSNYNTPTQFILGGPRETLLEARRDLRKRRIPAILLNVSLAFHHPSMRALREYSLNGLNSLEMHAPNLPMMSDVTTGLYPDDPSSICEYIADLDENAVRWVECVRNMWNIHGVRHFVEFGPADTLCGLTADIEERAVCIPAGRKGAEKEVEGMRSAVARLYALGHLPGRTLHPVSETLQSPAVENAPAASSPAPAVDPHIEAVMPIIMEASGLTRAELAPDMDLRNDLAIRSSRFPLIMHAVEEQFHITLEFEDIADVATIRDLARVLARLQRGASARSSDDMTKSPAPAALSTPPPPVLRYAAVSASSAFRPVPPDPLGRGLPVTAGDVILAIGDGRTLPALLTGLAPWRCTFLLPEHVPDAARALSLLGSVVRTASFRSAEADAVAGIVEKTRRKYGRIDGLLQTLDVSRPEDVAAAGDALRACIRSCRGLRYVAVAIRGATEPAREAADALRRQLPATDVPWRMVILSEDIPSDATADLLAREMLLSTENTVLLSRAALPGPEQITPLPRERAERFPLVFPLLHTENASLPVENIPAAFLGGHHFSQYGDPWLKAARRSDGTARAPEAMLLECLLETAVQGSPWLQATGATEIVFTAPVECPPGITREARIGAATLPWKSDEAVPARPCAVRLEARDISDNGRRRDSWSSICAGHVLLSCPAVAPETPVPLWTPGTAGGAAEIIADADALGYCFPMPALHALFRLAARTVMAARTETPFVSPQIVRIGRLRFSPAYVPQGGFHLELQGNPACSQHFRFHGQVADMRGAVRMTVEDLEMRLVPLAPESRLPREQSSFTEK